MDIAFNTRELRNICENKYHACKVLGDNAAELLFAIVSDILAAESVSELQMLYDLKTSSEHIIFKVDNILMKFISNHLKPKSEWQSVTRIKLQVLRKVHE